MQENIFHVALAVNDLSKTIVFYTNILGCKERIDAKGEFYSVIYFFGSQLVLIEAPEQTEKKFKMNKLFIEPVKHFGLIMSWDKWHILAHELEKNNAEFLIPPNIKEHENLGKVANMFLSDPSNNNIEFKSYEDRTKVI